MSKTEGLVQRRVIYTLEVDGKLHVVENVPARVNEETTAQFFAPRTIEACTGWAWNPPSRAGYSKHQCTNTIDRASVT